MTQKEQENLLFKNKNIIWIDSAELDMPVYRVFSKRWLIDALQKKKNTLVKPSMWDDPFENFIFKSVASSKDGRRIGFDQIRENYYGQCWTLNQDETDALWRIYSPSKDGFRVKTSIRKLFDAFYDAKHKWAMIAFYIGRIHYLTEGEIKHYFEDAQNLTAHVLDSSGRGQVQTLLIKRMEFKHENELRLVFAGHKDWYNVASKTYEFSIDVNMHFDSLLGDPRMSDAEFNAAVNEIRACGYNNPIEKSGLYKIPNFNLRLDM